jgi:hypothetical protein
MGALGRPLAYGGCPLEPVIGTAIFRSIVWPEEAETRHHPQSNLTLLRRKPVRPIGHSKC